MSVSEIPTRAAVACDTCHAWHWKSDLRSGLGRHLGEHPNVSYCPKGHAMPDHPLQRHIPAHADPIGGKRDQRL